MRVDARYKRRRPPISKLAVLAPLALGIIGSPIAVPGLTYSSGSEHEVITTDSTNPPKPRPPGSGAWRAEVRTWAAMIHYLFDPEPDAATDDDWSEP